MAAGRVKVPFSRQPMVVCRDEKAEKSPSGAARALLYPLRKNPNGLLVAFVFELLQGLLKSLDFLA